MPGIDGHELLRRIRELHPQVPVVLITAYGSIERSVMAMRDGAADYLVKPFQPASLIDSVARFGGGYPLREDEPIAVEQSSVELLMLARRVAGTDSTVLLSGESGKEVLARYIHRHSLRAEGPFVAINCAAIPENMLEALLFGHEKGAFTGAYASMPGKFEQAERGTLLLDEISEMHVTLQAKLLRVLQEREVERLGGRKPLAVDVRVIATSNRDLRREAADGRFREDLFYRLSVFPLHCIALRERPRDILPLAERLARIHAARMHHGPVQFDASAISAMHAHHWTGNVRELENAVQRALIMQPGAIVSAAHLRLENALTADRGSRSVDVGAIDMRPAAATEPDASESRLSGDLRQREFQVIVDMLKASRGSKSTAAERLGISARTLRYKLARLRESGMDVEAALMQ
jgi:two-component system, response regulator FlrC